MDGTRIAVEVNVKEKKVFSLLFLAAAATSSSYLATLRLLATATVSVGGTATILLTTTLPDFSA